MSTAGIQASDRASALRATFDRSFAAPRNGDTIEEEGFLAIQLGEDAYALRIAEIAGFHADKTITPLPSRIAELRGIAGFRGAMLPVYDLAALLGHPSPDRTRWMVIVAGAPVALAFDVFGGHFRFPRSRVASHAGSASTGRVHDVVRVEERVYSVIDLSAIIARIKERVRVAAPNEEQ